jgi:transcriptional regulator with XRE-family HTH domain
MMLSRLSGVSERQVRQLETGIRRPRRSTLSALADVLSPDAPNELLRALLSAAGPSIRPDTPASRKRRRRAAREARRAYPPADPGRAADRAVAELLNAWCEPGDAHL